MRRFSRAPHRDALRPKLRQAARSGALCSAPRGAETRDPRNAVCHHPAFVVSVLMHCLHTETLPPFAGTWYHIIRLVQARLDQFYSDNVHAQQASLHVCVCVCARARARSFVRTSTRGRRVCLCRTRR